MRSSSEGGEESKETEEVVKAALVTEYLDPWRLDIVRRWCGSEDREAEEGKVPLAAEAANTWCV